MYSIHGYPPIRLLMRDVMANHSRTQTTTLWAPVWAGEGLRCGMVQRLKTRTERRN